MEHEEYFTCRICPRQCGVNRTVGETGVCDETEEIRLARAALHMWEEPCISGTAGSGTVFFSGCSLRCVYCQNAKIATGNAGKTVSVGRLTEIFFELKEKGAENINLVTPTHYAPTIAEALRTAKRQNLNLPIVWNCSGYESVESLQSLRGLVDIYLTDFKYMESDLGLRYSHAADYPYIAKQALKEMVSQIPEIVFENDRMKRGIIVRHLLLPGYVKNAKAIVKYIHETYGEQVYLSLMNQYTPMPQVKAYPEINRKVTKREYQRLVDYAMEIGVEQGFIQEGNTAKESFIPAFEYEGV